MLHLSSTKLCSGDPMATLIHGESRKSFTICSQTCNANKKKREVLALSGKRSQIAEPETHSKHERDKKTEPERFL